MIIININTIRDYLHFMFFSFMVDYIYQISISFSHFFQTQFSQAA